MLNFLDKLPNVVILGCSVPPNISAVSPLLKMGEIKYSEDVIFGFTFGININGDMVFPNDQVIVPDEYFSSY